MNVLVVAAIGALVEVRATLRAAVEVLRRIREDMASDLGELASIASSLMYRYRLVVMVMVEVTRGSQQDPIDAIDDSIEEVFCRCKVLN